MKSLPKRRSGNKERQEREGEKLFGLGNLFRSKIKTNLLENISKKKKTTFYFLIHGIGFYSSNQKSFPPINPCKNFFMKQEKDKKE
jgi:hypothetical protein